MNFKPFTPQQIQEARAYAAEVPTRQSVACLLPTYGYASHITEDQKEGFSEGFKVKAVQILNGEHDHNFTIRQRMYYHLTSECVGFLPK